MQQSVRLAGAPSAPPARDTQEGRFDGLVVAALRSFNGFLHIMLAIALVAASIMVVWEFVREAWVAIQGNNLSVGFLHALGTLFLLWTLSALITAEIGYIRTSRFQLRVFIEVAMITLLRQLIVRPVQQVAGDTAMDWTGWTQFGLVLLGILAIGVVHRLVGPTTGPLAEAPPPPAE